MFARFPYQFAIKHLKLTPRQVWKTWRGLLLFLCFMLAAGEMSPVPQRSHYRHWRTLQSGSTHFFYFLVRVMAYAKHMGPICIADKDSGIATIFSHDAAPGACVMYVLRSHQHYQRLKPWAWWSVMEHILIKVWTSSLTPSKNITRR